MAEPREHWLATPDGDICWFEWGTPSDGPSVLLLHATGFHARLWDQVVLHLPPGTHIIAPDLVGHGRSYRPATLVDWIANAAALLPLVDQFAGAPLVACGHSGGGYILTWLAAQRPGAFRHLLLIDPTIFDPDLYHPTGQPIPDPEDHPVARRRNAWDSADAMVARFAERLPYSAWQPAVLVDYCHYGLLPAPAGRGYELACPPALEASVYQGAQRTNPYGWLASLAVPTSIIRAKTGERDGPLDFSVSPTWPGLGELIRAVRDEQWSDHSHFIPMEAPQRLADLVADQI
ncbi:alpha/beta fold hydrolase [Sphingopyxis sp.]|uniref:alpha/beta fold hydrolase n=1 Tax=Sphingopyxis sp. TaxID=1908224 RepID=UPI003D09A0F4